VSVHRTTRIVALLWLGALMVTSPVAAETRPPVVELFTSQGCSSCPPADALLGELARRGDVIALGFHIDYWDKLGWKDPLSTPQSTERQRRYARLFGTPIYTPQLVIDGAREMVGSQRETVLTALRETMPAAVAPVAFASDRHAVTIGPAAAATSDGAGQVWLVRFAQKRRTQIGAGENARRTLDDTNGVESLAALGEWRGSEATFPLEPPAPGEGIAVLVQTADGHILGAAILPGS
jgi:hypothetical protein